MPPQRRQRPRSPPALDETNPFWVLHTAALASEPAFADEAPTSGLNKVPSRITRSEYSRFYRPLGFHQWSENREAIAKKIWMRDTDGTYHDYVQKWNAEYERYRQIWEQPDFVQEVEECGLFYEYFPNWLGDPYRPKYDEPAGIFVDEYQPPERHHKWVEAINRKNAYFDQLLKGTKRKVPTAAQLLEWSELRRKEEEEKDEAYFAKMALEEPRK